MADVELVIRIPEEAKEAFDDAESNDLKASYYDHGGVIGNAIKNGIPLPEHHGRLIDADELLDDIGLEDNDENRDCNTGEIITLENIDRISTIIPATKEGESE